MMAETFLQGLVGTMLFLVVCVWAAYKIYTLPKDDHEDDDDIHLGI
jgi:hypothetical protein